MMLLAEARGRRMVFCAHDVLTDGLSVDSDGTAAQIAWLLPICLGWLELGPFPSIT